MTKRILLCDDELHILRAAEFKFKRAGYDVQCAGDGEEAWEMIQQQLPDVLITDCQMPRLDGLELAERIRSNPATAGLPVIMLTAKGYEMSRAELQKKLGISALMAKPFSPRKLLQYVDDLLAEATPAAESGETCAPAAL